MSFESTPVRHASRRRSRRGFFNVFVPSETISHKKNRCLPQSIERLPSKPLPVSRRDILKYIALATGGFIASKVGLRIAQTEFGTRQGISIPLDALKSLAQATLATQKEPQFLLGAHGLTQYPSMLKDEMNTLLQFKRETLRLDTAGVFGLVEDFMDARKANTLLSLMNLLHDMGAVPMFNAGLHATYGQNHPLHPENREQIWTCLKTMFKLLATLGYPHTIRIIYEMNEKWFDAGRNGRLPHHIHEREVRHTFRVASQLCAEFDPLGSIIISPNIGSEIIQYTPLLESTESTQVALKSSATSSLINSVQNEQDAEFLNVYLQQRLQALERHMSILLDTEPPLKRNEDRIRAVTLDGYIWHPGKGAFGKLAYWTHPYVTPEAIFLPSLIDIVLSYPDKLHFISEIGSMVTDTSLKEHTQDLEKIIYMTLILGGVGLMPFVMNKKPAGLWDQLTVTNERDWTPTQDELTMYRRVQQDLGLVFAKAPSLLVPANNGMSTT